MKKKQTPSTGPKTFLNFRIPSLSSTTLIIPDIQEPFAHRRALEFMCRVRDIVKPTNVVCIGDEADFHALGDWPVDPDGYSSGDEQYEMQKNLSRWFKEFPDVKACISNHTMRPYKRAFKHGIPTAMIRGYHELLKAPPGWSWEEKWIVDGVRYEHGDAFGSGDSAFQAAIQGNHRSTVFGHHHSQGGVRYFVAPDKPPMFAMNVGCLIDEQKYAFKYGRNSKKKPTLGCGFVVDGTLAIWVPMESILCR